ncbi:MAG: nucleotidyl transferase AbiEii/AbiGii toxin family protein [Gemmatimonadetes bacterium]|nr:nucleotidyl transferase AbiEii/AbiGii toxin family protein [Gemmatimonadota bacterium]
MIRKQDILDRAGEWQLRPEVVEKDYILGWLLAGLALSPARDNWVFKGGTCIKKCFFETYRFSEDLDFSLLPDAAYTEDEIRDLLIGITRATHELSGIEFPPDLVEIRARRDKQGQDTFQGRMGYRGPLAFPGYPRVLLDITRYEPVLDPPDARPVFHPYPESLPPELSVATYSFDELLAEKTRALYERARPRDLYDVVYLLENHPEAFDLVHLRELLQAKCEARGLACPSQAEVLAVIQDTEELRSEWGNMLAHQLPMLPDLDAVLARLADLLLWIEAPVAAPAEVALPTVPMAAGATLLAPAGIHYWGTGVPLETVRFAGANRLLIEFDYSGTRRVAEPYSLRRAESTGNLLLYAWEEGAAHIKAFNLDRISDVRATSRSFEPRYRIELSAVGP